VHFTDGSDLSRLSHFDGVGSKRPLPSTNLVEVIYRCEACGTKTKRMVKDT